MRTIVGVLSKIEKLQKTKKKNLWQQRFLYPLLFQDDLYAIAYNRFLNKFNLKKIENLNLNENFSFLTLKRLIYRIRQKKSLQFLLKNCKKNINADYKSNFYSRAVREGVTLILEITFSVQLKPFIKKFNEWNSYQSIHSVFPFIEDNFSHCNYILNIKIPYFLHPELLIRVFRRRIQDASFLHSLRFILHKNQNLIILDTNSFFFSRKEMTRLSLFLWNSYIYELEFFLIYLWRNLGHFKLLPYLAVFDQTNCIKKIQHVIKPSWMILQKKFICKKTPSFYYVRYENNFILSIKSTNYLTEKWKFFFFKFWQYHFHFFFKQYRIRIKKTFKTDFSFLGYIFGIQTRITRVQTKMLNDLPKTNLVNKELYSITPILPLIGLLAKEKFCDISGHPISKLAWTTLTDDEIFNRFDQIWKNIFYYYSGCINKNNLYQIQYILRFSCAKTLACKHKSTIRFIWKKYSSNFFAKSFFSKKKELICLHFSKIYPLIENTKKMWYLDIIQINSLANSLQKKIINNK